MNRYVQQNLLWVVGVSVALSCSSMTAQTARPHRSGAASSAKQPDKAETFVWLRSKLLALSPRDEGNDNQEVSFEESTCKLTVSNPNDYIYTVELGNLDASSAVWDIFNPSSKDGSHKWPLILRLTYQATPDKIAATNAVGAKKRSQQRAVFLFSMPLIADTPEVRNKITAATKHLITLCGGVPDTNAF